MKNPEEMTKEELVAAFTRLEIELDDTRCSLCDEESDNQSLHEEISKLESRIEELEGAIQIESVRPLLDMALAKDRNLAEYHMRKAGIYLDIQLG